MIQPLMSPGEIKASIQKVVDTSRLVIDIRKGRWDADVINSVVAHLEHDTTTKKAAGNYSRDKDFDTVLALLAVLFATKDVFGYDVDSAEYQSIQALYGRIIVALGL